jgi:hypothetical protein
MKYLLFYPGFLTKEYVIGHRARHLNPIRMYLFISAVFFLLYANTFVPKKQAAGKKTGAQVDTDTSRKKSTFGRVVKTFDDIDSSWGGAKPIILGNGDTITQSEMVSFKPATLAAYDSFQLLLPKAERETGFMRKLNRVMLQRKGYNEEDKREMNHRILAHFFHSIPYMLFISLPLLALLLKLLYIRRKEFYYVSHGIFTIHYFCFLFIALLLIKFLSPLGMIGGTLGTMITAGSIAYLYIAMYKFYRQGWFKTFVKFFLFYSIGVVFLGALLVGLLLNAVINVS